MNFLRNWLINLIILTYILGSLSTRPPHHLDHLDPSLVDVNQSRDPDGLRCFYYLVQVTPSSLITLLALPNLFSFLLIRPNLYSILDLLTVTIILQDLKCLVFSLIGLHFKIKPI